MAFDPNRIKQIFTTRRTMQTLYEYYPPQEDDPFVPGYWDGVPGKVFTTERGTYVSISPHDHLEIGYREYAFLERGGRWELFESDRLRRW